MLVLCNFTYNYSSKIFVGVMQEMFLLFFYEFGKYMEEITSRKYMYMESLDT